MIGKISLVGIALSLFVSSAGAYEFKPREAQLNAVTADVERILVVARMDPKAWVVRRAAPSDSVHRVRLNCVGSNRELEVRASNAEWASTLYYGLQRLGFLFPHPRIQISPDESQLPGHCGREYIWDPRFEFRGFHLHTQHPSEFVHGFLMGKRQIGYETVRWLARNGQNVLQVKLLKTAMSRIERNMGPVLTYAQRMGVSVGADVSFASLQQKSYRLVDAPYLMTIFAAATGWRDSTLIKTAIRNLVRTIPFDYISADMGMSEFTPTHYERTLEWLEVARVTLDEFGRGLFVKMHTSVGQTDPKYGNYNLLARFSHPNIGIQPHTVMPFGLLDRQAPVYGRTNFDDIRDAMLTESSRRPVWYFPETSYWVGVDVDVPLFLTDYLVSRSEDVDFVTKNGIRGHVNFTTGQELGYWLFDWTLALLTHRENSGDPLVGIRKLGEDPEVWRPILEFQTRHFKGEGLLAILSSANLMDELPLVHHEVLERNTMKDLSLNPALLDVELKKLELALGALPDLSGVKNRELRLMLQVTWARIEHAFFIRSALRAKKSETEHAFFLERAKAVRLSSLETMSQVVGAFERYPEAKVFARHENPTSYKYGYAWPAATLHFWRREEEMIRRSSYSPFFMNIYNPREILF